MLFKNKHTGLLARCKSGDNAAFKELYTAFAKPMLNASLRIVNNRQEAEDVLQEAFIKAFQRVGEFKEMNGFGAWLKKVVINRSIDVVRGRKLEWQHISGTDIADEAVEEEGMAYDVETV